jgi:uncharacterized membrane protein YqjE
MSTVMPPPDETTPEGTPSSIASVLQDITEKTQLLIKDEIELAKAEVEVKVKALARGAAVGAAAGIFVLAALLMLMHGFAWLAWYLLPVNNQSYFWGFFFVAVVFLVLAGIAAFLALRFFKKGSPPTPQMAIDEGKRIQQTVNTARAAEVKR